MLQFCRVDKARLPVGALPKSVVNTAYAEDLSTTKCRNDFASSFCICLVSVVACKLLSGRWPPEFESVSYSKRFTQNIVKVAASSIHSLYIMMILPKHVLSELSADMKMYSLSTNLAGKNPCTSTACSSMQVQPF